MKTQAQVALRPFSPECYFKDPVTGQTGWSIQFPKVFATNMEEAAMIIRRMPYFDRFIDVEFDKYNDDPKQYLSAGSVFFQVEHTKKTPNHAEIIAALEKRLEILKNDVIETQLTTEIHDTTKLSEL